MKKVLAIMVVGLLLASCGQHPLSGYVIDKKYTPAAKDTFYNPVFHLFQEREIPERWVVYVGDSLHNAPYNVTEETYQRLKKGQFVTAKGFERRWQGK